MARVVDGSHSFTSTSTPTRLSTVTSKQSARNCYLADVALVRFSNCHVSLGKWMYIANPQLLSERAVVRSRTAAQYDPLIDASHYMSPSHPSWPVVCLQAFNTGCGHSKIARVRAYYLYCMCLAVLTSLQILTVTKIWLSRSTMSRSRVTRPFIHAHLT